VQEVVVDGGGTRHEGGRPGGVVGVDVVVTSDPPLVQKQMSQIAIMREEFNEKVL
jgi:hypothetical protein